MKVQVRYFASLREGLGDRESAEVPDGCTVGALRDALTDRGGEHARLLHRSRAVRCALDQRLCEESAALREGAEVAFFPPVTGG